MDASPCRRPTSRNPLVTPQPSAIPCVCLIYQVEHRSATASTRCMVETDDRSAKFGRRLRELRVQSGLSQHKLAELAELDKNYVTEAERGHANPSLETIGRLAEALGVDDVALIASDSDEG